MSRGLVIALLTAGCLREPTYNGPRDADGNELGSEMPPTACNNTDVVVLANGMNDQGARACGPGYEMLFSDVGAKMPYQLNIGSSMILGNGQRCNDERGIGIGLFPSSVVNGENRAGTSGTLERVFAGPVIGRVKVNWDASYTCMQSGVLQDYSIFTFFPNGHITRFDRISQPTAVDTGNCTVCNMGGGSPSSQQFLTSFTTLQAPSGSALTGASISALTTYDQSVSNVRNPCLTTLQKNVAFGFRNANTRMRVANETPVRTIAFVQDIMTGGTIGPVDDHVTTHMLVSATTSCGDLAPAALAWANRPELMIGGTNMGPANDGIYGGENDSGNTAIQTSVGDIVIQPVSNPIPAGAAVWIELGAQPNQNVQVTRNVGSGVDWYRIQRVTNSQLIFYFNEPITAGTVITIRPG